MRTPHLQDVTVARRGKLHPQCLVNGEIRDVHIFVYSFLAGIAYDGHPVDVTNLCRVNSTVFVSFRSGLMISNRTLVPARPLIMPRHSCTLLPSAETASIFRIRRPADRPACPAGDFG